MCTGVDFHEVSSSLDHPSGLMSCDVHQHVTPWATYFCEAIAQRVGMGLRPGKLRKKALGKGYEDGDLTPGAAILNGIGRGSKFGTPGVASNPRGLLATPKIFRG